MKLEVLGTGSQGNCYVLEDNEGNVLLIELGLSKTAIYKALGKKIRKVQGCLVTHEHGDHAKGVGKMLAAGYDIYSSEGVFDSKVKVIEENTRVGNWIVNSFKVYHDAKNPIGFIISHKEIGNLLFLTDSRFINCTFDGFEYYMIECNYCNDLIDRNHAEGNLIPFLYRRILNNHLGLDDVLYYLRKSDTSKLKKVYLTHLSDTNSNEEDIRTKMLQTGIEFEICNNKDVFVFE